MNKLLVTLILGLGFLSAHAAEHRVSIENFAFKLAELLVDVGDTVVFTNNDRAPHNVIARESSPGQFADSAILRTGDSFTLEVTAF
jgi:plastocyanin